ncbi:MAG: phage portal protein [Candidatus Sumerlaeales bacterium]|nr:phage portal protein [Candidatus Sumerlaeales bacterium]
MITKKDIDDIWNRYSPFRTRYRKVKKYYDGRNVDRYFYIPRLDGREKTQTITNWVAHITGIHTGMLTSKSVQYDDADDSNKAGLDEVRSCLAENDADALDEQNFRNAFLYGQGVETISFSAGAIRITSSSPDEWAFSLDEYGNLQIAVRKLKLSAGTFLQGHPLRTGTTIYEIYTRDFVARYSDGDKPFHEIYLAENKIGIMPVNCYCVKSDKTSFFSESLLDACDLYNKTRGALCDDITHNVDAFLHWASADPNILEKLMQRDSKGVTVLARMRELSLIPTGKDDTLNFLAKVVDVDKFKYDLRESRRSIHLMGCIPDLASLTDGDGTITNISGVAIQMLFFYMLTASGSLSRQFSRGLRNRIRIINRYNELIGRPHVADVNALTISMRLNLPTNSTEIIQYVPNLAQVLGRKEIVSMIPQVDNPDAAIKESPLSSPIT